MRNLFKFISFVSVFAFSGTVVLMSITSIRERNDLSNQVLVLALYFPQFHNDSLNDMLWGEGYSDWKALDRTGPSNRFGMKILRPAFPFYDLLSFETRSWQASLARKYRIDGFFIHHYWFYGSGSTGPVLAAPLMQMLIDGQPNLLFAFHWANEDWKVTWHGMSRKKSGVLLQKQHYPKTCNSQVRDHYYFLRPFFQRKNYIKVRGQVVLGVYRPEKVPHIVLKCLEDLSIRDGFAGIHFIASSPFPHITESGLDASQESVLPLGFDSVLSYPFTTEPKCRKLPSTCGRINTANHQQHVGILSEFDNTARRTRQTAVVRPTTVNMFAHNLAVSIQFMMCCRPKDADTGFVVINAWNEWGEGMALEPSNKYGEKLLQAVADVRSTVTCSAKSAWEAQCEKDLPILKRYTHIDP